MTRNSNVDALRIVAAIGVISLHVGVYPDLAPIAGAAVRSVFRWCVPVFFIITGYFCSSTASPYPGATVDRLARPTFIFLIGTALFLPLFLARNGMYALGIQELIRGTEIHLWYLSSLPLSLIIVQGLKYIDRPYATTLLATAIVALYIIANIHFAESASLYGVVMILRHLVGIPCLLLGGYLHRVTHRGAYQFAITLLAGVALLLGEVLFLGPAVGQTQFLFSTIPIAVGLVGLSITGPEIAPAWMAEMGRKDSLAVYLFHPAFIVVATSLLSGNLSFHTEGSPGMLLWILTALLTVAWAYALRLMPSAKAVFDGDLKAFARRPR